MSDPFHLDNVLVNLPSKDGTSTFTIRESLTGCQIFGNTGSGKSSGSGKTFCCKYILAGYGGLVLTVKADEKKEWEEYCRLAGREADLLVLEPGGKHHFNFIDYEATSSASHTAYTENIVEVLKTVIHSGEEKDQGRKDDRFWETALDLLIFNTIDLCLLAYGQLSLEQLNDIVQTIPKANDNLKKPEEEKNFSAFEKAFYKARIVLQEKIDAWKKRLSKFDALLAKDPIVEERMMEEGIPELRLFRQIDQFFLVSFRQLNEKTRSIVELTFIGFIFRLLREPVFSLLCNGASTIRPEDSLNGKIILLNLPVKRYHKIGRDCQILFKYIWQRAMEKRDASLNNRPVFLWADEAQHFIHEHDAIFQTTARSSLIATVYLTQNLPNYFAAMGGKDGEYKVKSFLGTLATKIFHANADTDTNNYASELVGSDYQQQIQKGTTYGQELSKNHTISVHAEPLLMPIEFVRLRTGGPLNNHRVDAIIHRQGAPVAGGYNHQKVWFDQKF